MKALLFIVSICFSFLLKAQPTDFFDISSWIEIKAKLTKNILYDVKINACNKYGDLAGSFTNPIDKNRRIIFVIQTNRKTHKYENYIELGAYPEAIVTGISDEGHLVFNTKMSSRENFDSFYLRLKKDGYEKKGDNFHIRRILDQYPYGYVAGIRGNKIFGYYQFKNNENEQLNIPAYYKSLMGGQPVSESCKKGFVKDIETGKVEHFGFPLAGYYNFDSEVSAINEKVVAGYSKGYFKGNILKMNNPFFYEKDSTYLILAGVEGYVTAMNDNGKFIGVWVNEGTKLKQGFYFDRSAMNNERDGWQNIIGGMTVLPKSINNEGIVCGTLDGKVGFVWKDGNLFYLKDLLNKEKIDVEEVNDATIITNENILIGIAKIQGQARVFITYIDTFNKK